MHIYCLLSIVKVKKSNCHVRISTLPTCPEFVRNDVPSARDIGKLLSLSGNYLSRLPINNYHLIKPGTVTRTTGFRMLESEKLFKCAKCHQTFHVAADFEQYYLAPKPPKYS